MVDGLNPLIKEIVRYMSEGINKKSVRTIGILVAIIGALVAFIGGVSVGNAGSDIWNILASMALAGTGGLIAAIGGHIINLFKR